MTFRISRDPYISRNSHTIRHNGPGAVVRASNGISMLVLGLSEWRKSYFDTKQSPSYNELLEELEIHDTFLEQKLGVYKIISPPPYDTNARSDFGWFIPAIRFPIAQYCTNSNCRKIQFKADYGDTNEIKCNQCKLKRQPLRQIPVIFACVRGHIHEPQWMEICHKSAPCGPNPTMKFAPEPNMKNSMITCMDCNSRVKISDISKRSCGGERPWLPSFEPEQCDQMAEIIEAPSSNSYFPWAEISIVIPPHGELIPIVLNALRTSRDIKTIRNSGWRNNNDNINYILAKLKFRGIEISPDSLVKHLQALDIQGRSDDDKKLKESKAFLESRPRGNATLGLPDLIVEPIDFSFKSSAIRDFPIEAVSSIPRLRAISVLTGFSRVQHSNPSKPLGLSQLWGNATVNSAEGKSKRHEWLYGTEQFGEGYYLEFSPTILPNIAQLIELKRIVKDDAEILLKFMHTFSHLLLRVSAERSGFNLPSLRERLFLNQECLGILIYTVSPSIEGTSGGLSNLVEGDNLEDLITTALDLATWCTADPVCLYGYIFAESDDQERGSCHHCTIVPETSCERNNEDLDRMFVLARIPTQA